MLNLLDDFPIHQTPEPVAHPATGDANVYDRTWCNGYTTDGDAYFGLGLAVYPHRGIIDAAFSTMRAGGRQHCCFVSGRAPLERTDTAIGPFRLEIVEPMRTLRVIVDDNDSGVACDLTFSAHTAPIEEARQTLWSGARRFLDATRFDQFGRWSGTIVDPDGETSVDADRWLGTKDRSWGTRPVGPQPATAPGDLPQVWFLWAPLHWDDHVTHAIFFDDADGRPLVREALVAPIFAGDDDAALAAVADATVARDERMATARNTIGYRTGTRHVEAASIELVPHAGEARRIELTPKLQFQMKGIGYTHPEWGHAQWHGELAVGGETYEPGTLDPLAPENIHVQQVVTATDDAGRSGIGVLEHLAIGPHGPSGLADLLDGA